MNESGSLVWAVKKARERPKCNVVRHVSGKKASWYPWRGGCLVWEDEVTVPVIDEYLEGWSLVDEAPKVEVGSWWRAKNYPRHMARETASGNETIGFIYEQACTMPRHRFTQDFEPCEPPPREKAIRKLVALLVHHRAGKFLPQLEYEELQAAIKAVEETSGE